MKVKYFIGLAVMIFGLVVPFVFRPFIPENIGLFMVCVFPFIGALIMIISPNFGKNEGTDWMKYRDSAKLEEIRYYEQYEFLTKKHDK